MTGHTPFAELRKRREAKLAERAKQAYRFKLVVFLGLFLLCALAISIAMLVSPPGQLPVATAADTIR